jgi:hypothetical protein
MYLETDEHRGPTAADQLIEFMLNEDLIISEPESEQFGVKIKYRISHLGGKILDEGNWIKYKNQLEEQRRLENEIKILTVKELKGNIFQLNGWWLLLLISSVLSFIVSNFQWILSLFPK